MLALTGIFLLCFLALIACRVLLPTPFQELARLGVVWMSIVGAVTGLAYYWDASLWPLILLFADPVAVIHLGYVLISYFRHRKT